MKAYQNPAFFKVGNSTMVTVTVTMCLDSKAGDRLCIANAAEALQFFAHNNAHKSWVTKIEVK